MDWKKLQEDLSNALKFTTRVTAGLAAFWSVIIGLILIF